MSDKNPDPEASVVGISPASTQATLVHRSTSGSSGASQSDVDLLTLYLRHCAHDDPEAASLLRSYLYLFSKKAHSRFSDLVWFTASSVSSSLDIAPRATYSRCFQQFQAALTDQRYSPFQLCAVAETCDTPKKPFSFARNLSALFQGRTEELEKTIQILAIWAMCLKWAIKDGMRASMLSALQPHLFDAPLWEARLPSEGPLERNIDFFSENGETITFEWARDAPKYQGDLNVSMWQPQHHPPPVEHMQVIILPRHQPDEARFIQAFAVVKCPATLKRMRDSFDHLLKRMQVPGHKLDVYGATTVFLVSVMAQIRTDLKNFMMASRKQIRTLTLEGRRSPSAAKIQYLCHLDDSQLAVARCCHELAKTTQLLTSCCAKMGMQMDNVSGADQPHIHTLYEVETDIRYLAGEIQSNCSLILPLKRMVHEQMDLQSRKRTLIVQVLVALYVPLSFVSSFLGMNISSTNPTEQTNYTATYPNATAPQQSVSLSDATGAGFFDGLSLNKTSNAVGGSTWPMWTFWAAGVPLTVGTILVPLIAGTIFRAVFQSIHRYYPWWRLVVLCFYPPMLWIIFACRLCIKSPVTMTLASIIGYLPLLCLVLWQLHRRVRNARTPKSERVTSLRRTWLGFAAWLVFLLLSTAIFIVDFFSMTSEVIYGAEYQREINRRVPYYSLNTDYSMVETMGIILKHPDLIGLSPWIFLAAVYSAQAAFRWHRAFRRRRAENARDRRRLM